MDKEQLKEYMLQMMEKLDEDTLRMLYRLMVEFS